MKSILAALALLVFSSQLQAEIQLDSLKQWLNVLPKTLDERSETSSIYIKNYLQCMDDEQALRNESDTSLMELLNDAMASGNECAYLLEGLVEELTDGKLESPDNINSDQHKAL